ncbi:AIM24 family protein [Kitasatospora sp. A2-31]|uniref:AIM24 family protein n=1 Tax=Kitasatospora sp. A2-31 TaxID=2916414 RepID=UPI001EEF411A|nr:AIM24 family protein [Kitasatospora sp. A2-31]MCG6499308.1 AIM24 family protein [Kitasatospora sp. A2-31]
MERQVLSGTYLEEFTASPATARMSNHGGAMCKVAVTTGQDVLAKAGAMVAYDGYLQYEPVSQSFRRALGEWASGERSPLLRWFGDGTLYLADFGAHVLNLQLDDEALSVNGSHLLALDASLACTVEKVKGPALLAGTGLYNVTVRGSGWVSVTSHGVPVVLDCAEAPTYVDPDALVAWTTGLEIQTRRTLKVGSLIGRGSGEALQLGFRGSGFVVVQPSEETSDRFKIRG